MTSASDWGHLQAPPREGNYGAFVPLHGLVEVEPMQEDVREVAMAIATEPEAQACRAFAKVRVTQRR
jgi:hypothetical protein